MKKIFTLIFALAAMNIALAQSPDSFKYQAVARNAAGEVYSNTNVSFQISILQGSSTGTNVYTETHAATTNNFGLVSLSIGGGTIVSGDFSTIDWGNDSFFIQVEMDPAGGSNYQVMGTSPFLSVPYALHATTAESANETDPVYSASDASGISAADITSWNNKLDTEVDGDVTNEIQALSISNDTIYLSNGGFVKLPASFDGQYSSLTGAPTNVSSFTNDAGYLDTEVDGSVTNELQALSISNDTIYLSNGGFAKLPTSFDGQYSSLTGAPTNVSSFTNDAGYLDTEIDGSITNEIQALSISNDTIFLSNGGFAKLPTSFDGQYSSLTGAPTNVSSFTNDAGYIDTEIDGSITNELQALSISNDTIFLSNGGFVKLPVGFNGQYSSLVGAPTNVSSFTNDAGYITAEVDGSITNEIQDLQLTGDDLSITNNGSATTIDLSGYANYWNFGSGSVYRPMGFVGIGTSTPNSRLMIRDTLTSNTKAMQIIVEGGSNNGTTYNGIYSEIAGTDGIQRAAEYRSNGTNIQFNHGAFSLAANGSQNIGILANAGVGQASTNSSLNYGTFSVAENSATFNVGVVGKAGSGANFNYGTYGYVETNTGSKPNYGTGAYAYGSGAGKNYGIDAYAAGSTDTNFAVYASTGSTGVNYAGYFVGDVTITGDLDIVGNISKGGGTFKIDHPMDPENKYLVHSFVESPEMMNVFNGNITTDAQGFATVTMPDYFEASNKDFRYQLTVIGQFAQAIVKEKINGNKFIIQTNTPNVEVSWQVTGVRNDPYAQKNRIQPVVDKDAENKGKYLHPEAYGKSQSIHHKTSNQETPNQRIPSPTLK